MANEILTNEILLEDQSFIILKASLTEEECTQFRAAVGQLIGFQQSHPELSLELCQASSKIKYVTAADITSTNKVIYKAKKEQAYIHFPTLDVSSASITYQMGAVRKGILFS